MKRLFLSIGQAVIAFGVACSVALLTWAVVTLIYVMQGYFRQNWSVIQILVALGMLTFVSLVAIFYRINRT